MAGGKLTVEIGADITDFEKKIKEVEFDIKELSKVKLDQLKLGLDTTQINSQIKDAKQNLNSLKTTVKDTGTSFAGMTPKVANGGNALMQFSRIAQDAPYGIMGIGNNITATAEAFSYLKQSTGSTGGALKALASSLMGTGGILLGVSLLTTGLTLLSQSGLSVGDVIDKLTGKYNAFGAELKKVAEEAAKQSGTEIANMKALVSVAQDDTLSRENRLIAVKELQKEFPAYFGNLSTEKILNGDLTTVTNELTAAIVARAKASAYAGKIGELAAEELKINAKLLKAKEDLIQAEKDLKRENAASINTSGQVISGTNQNQLNAGPRISSIKKDLIDIRNELYKNIAQQGVYTSKINESTKASIGLNYEETKAPKIKKAVKTKFDFEPTFIAPFVSTISGLGDTMDGFANRTAIAFSKATGTVKTELTAIELALKDFDNRANEIIKGAMVDTFAGIGSAIGNALANGGSVLGAIGQSLLASLGGLLIQMGKMAIEIGVGLIAVKTALKSLNPYVAIAAGVGLVALGSIFSSKSKSIGGSIGGGGGGASSSTGGGANNQSFTSSGFSGGGNNGGTVVFEIAGQKLIGVLSNTLNANRRLGGQLAL
jgi:hypothetical protein